MKIQFARDSYESRALPLAAQQVINLFAENAPPDAKDSFALFNSPGIKSFGTGGIGPSRGAHVMDGIAYNVSGQELYSFDNAGAATLRGTIAGGGRVSMAHNAVGQLAIVNGVEGYIYTVAGGLVTITDVDFTAADTVTFQDDYFIFNRAGTGIFFISNLNDGLAYTSTDFATAEGDPDDLVAVFSNHRELWLFGARTTEVWFNSGDTDFPFERLSGAFIERGCGAAHTPRRIDNTLYWLGEDRIVYRASGYVPERISTHAIEQAIEGYAMTSDAFAFTWTLAGHKFYTLQFPTAGATWEYDASTQLWHERQSHQLSRWRANSYVRAYDKHLVGDSENGSFGEMDWDTFQEYGATQQWIAASPPIDSDRKRIFHSKFELDIESGVGLTSGQGSDPQIQLDWSDDGGRSFSIRKPWRSMGKIGEYKQRLRWLRMGQARNRIYRIEGSDPVKRSIIAGHLDAQPGTS